MSQRDPRSYNTWRIALEDGDITPIEALLRWTYVAMSRRVMDLEEYTRLVTKTLPSVEWHQPGEETELPGYLPVTWTCAADFFEWADSYLGHIFSLGSFLREYIAEHDPGKKARLVQSKQADIATKVREAAENPLPANPVAEGKAGPGRGNKTGDNVTRLSRGNDQTYTLRRLARDNPELLGKVEAGELTANAAAIEAGFRKPTKSIPVDSAESAVRGTAARVPGA
ncbi:hypothetical protein TVNIR_2101 [Thioalkalivibrio nitratireducens DSM 14787]|uniref:Uncharacterized protein n=1 Tax=Thioalkalivibrio nitratireducens (strain DSM 14787 / UNIQEM 213 / ALEN2) TaxID=1255043 RepID=L0DZE4_THIND|nr:hypothetical protein [Thioalkalivibrio nitratireducens]AGA33761.1 hypothetical protein TVNIR_2101 [Thioalkalivibrio nitratireducens DSM 14787]